jgi:hypothetical protein
MQFLNNRYVQLSMLTLFIAILLLLLEYVIFMALHIDFPMVMRLMLAVLASGYLVYKFFSQRVA